MLDLLPSRSHLNLALFVLASTCVGCAPSQPIYEQGSDTVASFGNSRFQIVEGSPQQYSLNDGKPRPTQFPIQDALSWKQSGHFAYIISKSAPRFHLLDIPAERLSHYTTLSQLAPAHASVFRSMFTSKNSKSKP